MMEGSESGALTPSDTTTEVETWVKFSNFPAEFLTSDALGMIASSIGSPVMMDEETYEKLENHKWPPKLRRKLHSSITFVRALVRVSVTEPLRPTVVVYCPQGRKYTVRIDYDSTPKICLNCLCAGHFDFECCGIDKDSVEIIAETGGDFLEVNSQHADCFGGVRADIHGEQGAVSTDGIHCYEDSTVVEAALMVDSHILPAASCDIGAAAVSELIPLLPAIDHGVQGTLITEGSGNLPPAPCELGAAVADLQAEEATVMIMVDDAEAGEDLLGVDFQFSDCFDSMCDEVDGEQGAVTTDGVESYEDITVVEAMILPAAACDFDVALVGELEAVHTILDGLFEQSLVEKTAAVLEVQTLLPATIAADGSEGTIISDGFVCYEDPPVVEAVLEENPHSLPPASCDFGAAIVGDLEAVQTFLDRFDDEPLVGKELAADPATVGESIAADLQELAAVSISDGFDKEPTVERIATVSCLVVEQVVGFIEYLNVAGILFGVLFSGVFSPKQHHKWREKTDVQGLLVDDSGSGVGLLGFDRQVVDCLSGTRAFLDGVHGAVFIDRAESYDIPPVFEADLEEDFYNIEQVFSVLICPKKHHKWREKSDVQGLFCCSYGLGSFGFDEDPSGECKETAAVLPFSDSGAASCGEAAAVKLKGMADPCKIDVQVSSGVNSSKKHHIWCEILDEQGLFSVEKLDMLQILGRLVWNLAATNHDQLFFKIQHKWRDKGMLI